MNFKKNSGWYLVAFIAAILLYYNFSSDKDSNKYDDAVKRVDSLLIVNEQKDIANRKLQKLLDLKIANHNTNLKQIDDDFKESVNREYSNDELRELMRSINNRSQQRRVKRDSTKL